MKIGLLCSVGVNKTNPSLVVFVVVGKGKMQQYVPCKIFEMITELGFSQSNLMILSADNKCEKILKTKGFYEEITSKRWE